MGIVRRIICAVKGHKGDDFLWKAHLKDGGEFYYVAKVFRCERCGEKYLISFLDDNKKMRPCFRHAAYKATDDAGKNHSVSGILFKKLGF